MNENSALFKYELAIVAILKNEAPYIKEWIDYHLLAGIDHFYICNNDSEDNLKEVLQPYIDKNIVDYSTLSGREAQIIWYDTALKKYRFDCKYIMLLDADEFIQPLTNQSVKECLHEILKEVPEAEGLTINWQPFNSFGQEKADFTRGVIERFLYRNVKPSNHVKTIFNPRCVNIALVHHPLYYDGKFSVYEDYRMGSTFLFEKIPATVNKIRVNHYHFKSREEYIKKIKRGTGDGTPTRTIKSFDNQEKVDTVYDDSILKYVEFRKSLGGGGVLEPVSNINQRRFNALIKTLSPLILTANLSSVQGFDDIFIGKIHVFLTCLSISNEFKNIVLNESDSKFFEELSLKCLHKSIISGNIEIWQMQLLIDEIPKILKYSYQIVDEIKKDLKQIIPQFMNYRRMQGGNEGIRNYKQLDYILQML